MNLFSSYNNIEASVIKLLKASAIHVNSDTIIDELEKHPDYPSLLTISDVLNNFNIKNNAFRLEPGELQQIACPFIVHTSSNGGDFVVVNQIDADTVVVSSEKWNKHKIKLGDFQKTFKGIVLTIDPSDVKLPEKTFTTTLNQIKTPLAITGLLLILVAALVYHTDYFAGYTWQILLLTLFKTAGLITSVLLLVQAIDGDNPLIQKLCTGANTNCKAILSSKAAKVFDWLSWSEVGFFYFAGTWLVLLFGGHSVSLLQVLAVLNIVSLPYTFYSIYYQARIAKQWCVLCCTVQALLWLEFIPGITSLSVPFTMPNNAEWSTLLISLLLPVVLWVLVKPLLLKIQQLDPLKEQLRKFKYNSDLFNSMLNNQPKYTLPATEWSIILGNAEASNSITMVTNPYCAPCSKTHKLLDELLDLREDLQARIVFSAENKDEDLRTPISRHLMALNELPDKTIVKRALHDWYAQKQKDYNTWAKIYPIELNESNYYKLDNQKDWCAMAEVVVTPTLLLNGYRLPDAYQLPDLKYMLE